MAPAEECNPVDTGIIYQDYIMPTIFILCIISMIPFVYSYIASYTNGKLKASKSSFVVGLVFYLTIFIWLLVKIPASLYFCHDIDKGDIFSLLALQIYNFTVMMLFGILFYRLYIVFVNTSLALSKCAIISFCIFYVLTLIVLIPATYVVVQSRTNSDGDDRFWMLGITGFTLIFVLNISLMCSFIFKLVQAYKAIEEHGERLIRLITKTSFLCFLACLSLLLLSIFAPLSAVITSIHWRAASGIFAVLDVYTNFLCVYLSFDHSRDYYYKMCGWCDLKCYQFWMCCIGANAKEAAMNLEVSSQNETTVNMQSPDSQISVNSVSVTSV